MHILLKNILAESVLCENTAFSADRSKRTEKFRRLANLLPQKIQQEMIKKFVLWKNTGVLHNFSQVVSKEGFYRIELPQHYRAVAKYDNGYLIWIWCGSHEAYNTEARALNFKYANIQLREDGLDDEESKTQDLFSLDGSVNL